MKHQGNCFRNINGRKYINYSDLIQSESEQAAIIQDAKKHYTHIRKIKHPSGYYQLFVSDAKKYKAELIEVGRYKTNHTVFFNTNDELIKEISRFIASKGFGLEETEIAGTYQITSGYRTTGTVIVKPHKP